jgi:hypothetical protein
LDKRKYSNDPFWMRWQNIEQGKTIAHRNKVIFFGIELFSWGAKKKVANQVIQRYRPIPVRRR